jgi:hypothetical protein
MDDKERSQFVDDLLEASLARYSSVAPRPGLEGRVLANVRARQSRRSWLVWTEWLAVGAAAAVLAVGVFNFAHRLTNPAPPKSVEVSKTGSTSIIGTGSVAVSPSQRRHASLRPFVQRATRVPSRRTPDDPRMAVFPSPQPPTSEEKLMSQYVRAAPAQALLASSTETTKIQEIQIEELEISPLADELADSKNNK